MWEESIAFLGADVKLLIKIEPIGGITIDSSSDITIEAYCTSRRSIKFEKNEIRYSAADNGFIVVVPTEQVGTGTLKCRITVNIDDGDDLKDNVRTEVTIVDTGIRVVNSI